LTQKFFLINQFIMERKEFLSLVGLSSASALAAVCMGSCSKSTENTTTPGQPTTPANVNITLDLTQAANASLATPGGYIYTGAIIVAKTISGSYIAVSKVCTHQGSTIEYQGTNQRFYCPNHGATFSDTGSFIAGPDSLASLKQYKTTLSGNMLTITS
jgi:cytochrome b6-f complex iron-sulfur subunit